MIGTTIARGEGFALTSYGNGLAYDLSAPDGSSVFTQGDDAAQFRDEWQAMESAWPERGSGALLRELFNVYCDVAGQ
jgi:hypothetical protein